MIVFSALVGGEFQESFGLGGCQRCTMEQLHAKMLQYSSGTKFQLDARHVAETRVQRIFSKLGPWATEHGFSLQIYGNQDLAALSKVSF